MLKSIAAPDHWRCIDFISDLHLQVSEPETFAAWQRYMTLSPADAIIILGDWFEVWVGDDNSDAFIESCVKTMQAAARSKTLFVMRGNRDFLLGDAFINRCGATLLDDPCVLTFQNTQYLLTHGDELCTDDIAYMTFRKTVRNPQWQADFLAKPLPERKQIAAEIRAQSREQHGQQTVYDDLNAIEVEFWLNRNNCDHMIHGHTHRPENHATKTGVRYVLSDWDAKVNRTQVLRLTVAGITRSLPENL